MEHRVLIVEDNAEIAALLRRHLGDLGCRIDHAGDGPSAVESFTNDHYDLVILDLMLPGFDGVEVCKRIRALGRETAIIMLTARTSELDRVLGLEVGADDYIAKPFSIPELLARCRVQFRHLEARWQAPERPPERPPLVFGGLEIEPLSHAVRLAGEPVHLTAKEFALLLHFARHPGQVFTRMQLLEQVWDTRYAGYEHTVNSHINRLRRKIEADPATPRYIETVWGVGYRFNGAG